MVRNVRDVLRSADRNTQENGITRYETIQLFLRNGYGDRRAIRRTNEAIVGCQLQQIYTPDGDIKRNEAGEILYSCVWWPFARYECDITQIIATVTDRQGLTHRIDDPHYRERVLSSEDFYNLK